MSLGPAWRLAGTSVVGAYHADANEACQDRYRLQVTRAGVLIAVASDGAGSAQFGGEGAELLCERVLARLELFFDAGFVKPCSRATLAGVCRAIHRAVGEARAVAAERGAERGVGIEAFHATLVGALMMPGRGGMFFHIGDGAAIALSADGQRWQMSPPMNGEYSHETYFFTGEDWRQRLRLQTIPGDFDTIFVMTDGVTDLALSQQEGGPVPFLPFFEPVARYLAAASRADGEQALTETLDSPQARERTNDDKTLLWAQAVAR